MQRPIRRADPATLRSRGFAEGSMGPKVLAACEFVEKTGKRAMIGSMTDTPSLLTGETGTTVTLDVDGLELGPRETNHS
jgi:carbamate kinase